MTKEKKQVPTHLMTTKVKHEAVRWRPTSLLACLSKNSIVDTPVVYGLIERRTLYFITGEVKHYMRQITVIARSHRDAWVQVMQVMVTKFQI